MLDAHIFLGALSMVFLCGVDVVWAQTTVSISATASHPVPTTLCEFGLAIMLNGMPLIDSTVWLYAVGQMFEVYLVPNEFIYMTNDNSFPGYKCMKFSLYYFI